jgi:L-threonylcarbamoyladenylate synthase
MKEVECFDLSHLNELGEEVRTSGKTVVFPTDTVFGLGANPLLEEGVEACFRIKGRDDRKPMPILFSEVSTVERFVDFDFQTRALAGKFWPGGLTLVMKVKKGLEFPRGIVKDHSMAVRIPNHQCCIDLIRACGGILIGTSANRSGERSYANSNDSGLREFASNCDYLVKGECSRGTPSTILAFDPKGKMRIIREGAIPIIEIVRYLEKTSKADFS